MQAIASFSLMHYAGIKFLYYFFVETYIATLGRYIIFLVYELIELFRVTALLFYLLYFLFHSQYIIIDFDCCGSNKIEILSKVLKQISRQLIHHE